MCLLKAEKGKGEKTFVSLVVVSFWPFHPCLRPTWQQKAFDEFTGNLQLHSVGWISQKLLLLWGISEVNPEGFPADHQPTNTGKASFQSHSFCIFASPIELVSLVPLSSAHLPEANDHMKQSSIQHWWWLPLALLLLLDMSLSWYWYLFKLISVRKCHCEICVKKKNQDALVVWPNYPGRVAGAN